MRATVVIVVLAAAAAACGGPAEPEWCNLTYHFSNVPIVPMDSIAADTIRAGVTPDSVTVEYCAD